MGYDIVVTGHYARVEYNEATGRYFLKKGFCLLYTSYTPPVTPWESVMPEVSDSTERRELPKAGLVTGVKS